MPCICGEKVDRYEPQKIDCVICKQLFHWKCTELSAIEFEYMKDKFYCKICQKKRRSFLYSGSEAGLNSSYAEIMNNINSEDMHSVVGIIGGDDNASELNNNNNINNGEAACIDLLVDTSNVNNVTSVEGVVNVVANNNNIDKNITAEDIELLNKIVVAAPSPKPVINLQKKYVSVDDMTNLRECSFSSEIIAKVAARAINNKYNNNNNIPSIVATESSVNLGMKCACKNLLNPNKNLALSPELLYEEVIALRRENKHLTEQFTQLHEDNNKLLIAIDELKVLFRSSRNAQFSESNTNSNMNPINIDRASNTNASGTPFVSVNDKHEKIQNIQSKTNTDNKDMLLTRSADAKKKRTGAKPKRTNQNIESNVMSQTITTTNTVSNLIDLASDDGSGHSPSISANSIANRFDSLSSIAVPLNECTHTSQLTDNRNSMPISYAAVTRANSLSPSRLADNAQNFVNNDKTQTNKISDSQSANLNANNWSLGNNKRMVSKTVIGTDDNDELSAYSRMKWIHLSSFKNSVSSVDIINYIVKRTNIARSLLVCTNLVKRDAVISDLKFVNFKLGVPANYYKTVFNQSLWPANIKLRPFVFLEKQTDPIQTC